MLKVLIFNAGSSTLKWAVLEHPGDRVSASGNEPLPPGAKPELAGIVAKAGAVDAIAHRVVHGGAEFHKTTRIDARVHERIEALREIDPLHTPRSLEIIDAATRAFPGVPQYACFDTAFHAGLPPAASTYAIPHMWTERWQLYRYGFHGLSVAWSVRRASELVGRPLSKLVVCHLGSGCSVTGVVDGQSRDTTMGFTPLEGLVMSTRSGSVDPGILLHLLRERGLRADELDHALERESGLLGLSGVSADLREVMSAAQDGDARAQLAYDVFVHSVRRAIGQMLASLGGLDAVVFTGGIGEHSAQVRADALSTFAWLGLALDPAKNASAKPDVDLSLNAQGPRALVIEAREDLTMLREVASALGR